MTVLPARLLAAALAAGVAALVASLAGAAPAEPGAQATAAAVQILVPGQPGVSGAQLVGPPGARTEVPGFSYPDDGSVVRIGSATASVAAQPGASASAQALTSSLALTLFGGEIGAASVTTSATAAAGAVTASAATTGSKIDGLTVLGQPVTAVAGAQLPLADWGTLELLAGTSETQTAPDRPKSGRAEIVALRVRLSADHGGLPAGSEIDVGVAKASAVESPGAQAERAATPAPKPQKRAAAAPVRRRPIVEPGTSVPGTPPDLVRAVPEGVRASLSSRGFVFPVYGPASFGDTFGAARPDVAGGWHHGEDIFAPLGTPLLAVAVGTVHTVGWNEIGGWRLWLRDDQGDEFYYAHLSAYSPLATEGRRVRPGDVLGFMGKSGDAEFSPPHLHFEIHPAAFAALGYDGVVAPYPFLVAWRRAQDVPFSAGRVYTPDAGGLPRAGAPPPGAVLLRAADVSATSGLVPGALERALTGERAGESPSGG